MCCDTTSLVGWPRVICRPSGCSARFKYSCIGLVAFPAAAAWAMTSAAYASKAAAAPAASCFRAMAACTPATASAQRRPRRAFTCVASRNKDVQPALVLNIKFDLLQFQEWQLAAASGRPPSHHCRAPSAIIPQVSYYQLLQCQQGRWHTSMSCSLAASARRCFWPTWRSR